MSSAKVMAAVAGLALGAGASSDAAFVVAEDFSSYSVNYNIVDSPNWWGNTAAGRVVADPADASNRVLAISGASGIDVVTNGGGVINVPEGGVGTLAMRLRWGNAQTDVPFGLASTGGWWPYQSAMKASWGSLRSFNDSVIAPLTEHTWYSMWMVHDAANQKFDVYLGDANWQNQQQIASGLSFTGGAVDRLLFRTFVAAPATVYVDDIYFDSTGANLSPIPEPVSMGIIGMAGLALLARKRVAR